VAKNMQLGQIFTIIQIIISALLIVAILFQQRGAGSSAITGGSAASYYTKRGFEKTLFIITIILAILFLASALANPFINS
jgi:preprotein translocase subunit SecG